MKYEAPELLQLPHAIDAIQSKSIGKSYVTLLSETSVTYNDTLPGYMDWED